MNLWRGQLAVIKKVQGWSKSTNNYPLMERASPPVLDKSAGEDARTTRFCVCNLKITHLNLELIIQVDVLR
ncbi:hypothetical protein NUACC26_008590 [Scytonema sp. NUACC26]